jgi:hypothetical protein
MNWLKKLLQCSTRAHSKWTPAQRARLLEARKRALAHFNEQPERSWALEWATQSATRFAEPFSYNLRAWAVLLALLTSLAGAVAWQSFSTQGSEIADIDEGLLTSELPINAYLDRSLDSWLKAALALIFSLFVAFATFQYAQCVRTATKSEKIRTIEARAAHVVGVVAAATACPWPAGCGLGKTRHHAPQEVGHYRQPLSADETGRTATPAKSHAGVGEAHA